MKCYTFLIYFIESNDEKYEIKRVSTAMFIGFNKKKIIKKVFANAKKDLHKMEYIGVSVIETNVFLTLASLFLPISYEPKSEWREAAHER